MNAAQLENLCRKIAPGDLENLYIMFSSQVPSHHRSGGLGYCGPDLDLVFKSALVSAGRWAGRGRCFYIDDIKMSEKADQARALAGASQSWRDDYFNDRVINVSLHELTHAIVNGAPSAAEPVAEKVIEIQAKAQQWVAESLVPETEPMAWIGHDWRFIHVLCGVVERAERLGVRCVDNVLFDPLLYKLSSLSEYRLALGKTDAESSFSELIAAGPNEAFMDVWSDDITVWFERNMGVVRSRVHAR